LLSLLKQYVFTILVAILVGVFQGGQSRNNIEVRVSTFWTAFLILDDWHAVLHSLAAMFGPQVPRLSCLSSLSSK